MRGRKPAAILAGSSPVAKVPNAPAWLSKDARAEWKRVAVILTERNVLTEGDMGTLESYYTSIGVMREASRQIQKDGMVLAGKRHPLFGVQNNAQTTARLCAAELGLTPVSRSRPSIRDDGDGEDLSDLGL